MNTPISGIVSLKEMLDFSMTSGNATTYLFHGSNVPLMPGRDKLIPYHKGHSWGLRYPISVADMATAMGYALDRTVGNDKMTTDDFVCFLTRQYRIVVQAFMMDVTKDLVNKTAYLYMVDAGYFPDGMTSDKDVPILARADIQMADLKESNFHIDTPKAGYRVKTLKRISNNDAAIEQYLLPKLAFWEFSQLGRSYLALDNKSSRTH